MAIRIPVERSDEYIAANIAIWLPLADDDRLVAGLHEHLEGQLREKPRRGSIRFPDILGTPLYLALDEATQKRIRDKVAEIEKDRAGFRRKSAGEDLTNVPLLDLVFRPRRKRETKVERKLREKRRAAVEMQY